MEIPILGQFKILLAEDKPFRDYLNAFLNLPVNKCIQCQPAIVMSTVLHVDILQTIHVQYGKEKL